MYMCHIILQIKQGVAKNTSIDNTMCLNIDAFIVNYIHVRHSVT